MIALSIEPMRWSPLQAIVRWWKTRNNASELRCYAETELEQIARDVGVSVSDLHALAKLGPNASDLLLQRMRQLDLDREEIARVQPGTLHDLQRVCALCQYHRRCARDLAQDPSDPAWESYCPNVAMLKTLNALPWASRNEW